MQPIGDAQNVLFRSLSEIAALRWIMSLLLLFAVATSCSYWAWPRYKDLSKATSHIRKRFPEIRQISTEGLARWIRKPRDASLVLLDVRTSEEFAVSHIRGARLIVPGLDPMKSLTDVEKDRTIVAYCSLGHRSSQLVRELQNLGYTNVYNLEGSIFKWANEGRELVRGEECVQTVHPYNDSWGHLLDPIYRSVQD